MRILGIDPGSVTTGFGIIDQARFKQKYVASGCIRIGKQAWPERLGQLHEQLTLIVQEFQPQALAIERVFVDKNVASALKLGQVRGAVMVVAAQHQLAFAEYAPRMVKKAVVGYGAADKNQIQHMMMALLELNALPQADAADALAIAMCHGHHSLSIA